MSHSIHFVDQINVQILPEAKSRHCKDGKGIATHFVRGSNRRVSSDQYIRLNLLRLKSMMSQSGVQDTRHMFVFSIVYFQSVSERIGKTSNNWVRPV